MSVMSLTSGRSALTCCTASAMVLYIFQLPAIRSLRMEFKMQNAKCKNETFAFAFCILNLAFLFLRQRRHSRQLDPAEELERGAAACRDVRDPVGNTGL